MAKLFEIGDRVRARTSRVVPAGTLGHIRATLISSLDLYFVQFDGEHRLRLMHMSDLELVTDAPADESTT